MSTRDLASVLRLIEATLRDPYDSCYDYTPVGYEVNQFALRLASVLRADFERQDRARYEDRLADRMRQLARLANDSIVTTELLSDVA